MNIIQVDVLDVIVSNNRRKPSQKAVMQLADSILEIGLQNPIGITKDRKLIHGRHRLEAYVLLQRKTIPAVVHDLDELHAELAEIDENIQRRQLSAAEEAKALARRKDIYLVLHPETKRGGAPGAGKGKGSAARKSGKMSFIQDTAEKTGKAKRSVERDVALGNALPDEIVAKIADTPVADNKSQLKKLAKLEPEMQSTVADLLAEGECTTVDDCLRCDDEPEEEIPQAGEVLRQRVGRLLARWYVDYTKDLVLAAAVLEGVSNELREKA